jgi:hypothetical protein
VFSVELLSHATMATHFSRTDTGKCARWLPEQRDLLTRFQSPVQSSEGLGRTARSVNGTFADYSDVEAVSSVTFYSTGSAPTFSFTSQLFMSSAVTFSDVSPDPRTATVDFGNTAQLELILPDGVTLSSASGQFLQSVPEPTSLSLVALGVAALLLRPRRD